MSKKRKTKKKLIYKGEEVKSGLELYAYKALDKAGLEPEYEKHSYTVYPSIGVTFERHISKPSKDSLVEESGKVRAITYKPDFVSYKYKYVIETKGFIRANDSFPLREKLFFKYMMDNDMGDWMYFRPRNQKQVDEVIKHIKSRHENQSYTA